MPKQRTPQVPYVPVEVSNGRLVRVCPECKEEIVELTDPEGRVGDNFTAHWQAEHSEHPPNRERCYVLGMQPRTDGEPGPEVLRDVSHQILSWVRAQMPDLDWELVQLVEDLPEGTPALIASEVLRGSWGMKGDDPQVRKVRWYRREGDSLVFTPTPTQWDEWDSARHRASDFRAALLERHRDELPKFRGKTINDWETYYERLRKREAKIANAFDAQCDAASKQFHRGDHHWQTTLEAAISELAIPDEEVDELRERVRTRIEEAEAQLSSK
jgi:virulence-associated protein VagC